MNFYIFLFFKFQKIGNIISWLIILISVSFKIYIFLISYVFSFDPGQLELYGNYLLFFSGDMLNATTISGNSERSPMNVWVIVLVLLGAGSACVTDFFGSLLVPCVIFTVWLQAKSFSTCIIKEGIKWPEIYLGYQVIRELCDVTSNSFGTLIVWYTASAVLGFTISLDTILANNVEVGSQLNIVFLQMLTGTVLLLAADVHSQVLMDDKNK